MNVLEQGEGQKKRVNFPIDKYYI